MAKYVHRPIAVEAVQLSDATFAEANEFLLKSGYKWHGCGLTDDNQATTHNTGRWGVLIQMERGVQLATPGEWVVQHADKTVKIYAEDEFYRLFERQ